MKEYIEREALGKAYVDLCLAKSRLAKSRKGAAFLYGCLLPEEEPTVKELFGLINAAPAADVVEVVRCNDCKHYERRQCYHTRHDSHVQSVWQEPNDFCSYGERRSDP